MHQILLVEDERWVRTVIRKTIEKTGLPFQVAQELKNGLEAYDWLAQHQVDLVLTDVRMPAMDGISLMKEVRRREMETDIIIISGHDDFAYTQQAIRLGAFDYLLKPVEQEGMTETLNKWLLKKVTRNAQDIRDNQPTADVNELSPIEQVLLYIDQSTTKDVSLAEAAEKVHLSTTYFCKLFKKETGTNYSDYIVNIRLKEAARLLEQTSLRISEIAERLGYADLAYFSNCFKKQNGITPSQFRKIKSS
ncbi:response regulator transcription factor [Bacillus sinesaloumensis]|uniref:response regulator transcription factor n=1 Tax=Litchfieldia sinesaloumensis TaxID=1926280 RepID=UPI000988406F|nr:response regulator [Bacillus sinesaloumensis]